MQELLAAYPEVPIAASIVWVNMLPADSAQAASEAVSHIPDRRARHFHDPDNDVGRAIAGVLGWEGQIAWDIYLFYEPGARWHDTPPLPVAWMHQLRSSWATPAHRHRGEDLVESLHATMARLSTGNSG